MRWRPPLWLAALWLLAGCGEAPAPGGKLEVVASFYPLYEFTRQVAGERAVVSALVPPGVEPHDWEPSPQELRRLTKARIVVYNGGGLEPWIDRFLAQAGSTPPLAVRAADGLPLIAVDLPAHGDGRGTTKGETTKTSEPAKATPTDPHVWLDPVLAQSMVESIRAALAKADPDGAQRYADNARAFAGRLSLLHRAFEAGLRECARRDVVVSHAAFGYLARRYGLSVISVMGVAPESEPSPAQLAAIVRFARQRKVKYIFFETLVSPRLAETLAREVGAQTLVFNPIEGLTREEAAAGKDYVALMEENLKNLRLALECR